jgi:hypothetical protein
MIPRIRAVLIGLCFFSGAVSAQTCTSLPYTLTNGAAADANQVMANFSYVLACAALRGWIGGLTMSNDGTSPNTVIDISAGGANSDDASTLMSLAAFTKNANAAWAVGTSNGCLDSGSSLANNTWYHLFVVARTDTGVVDELCSTSATTPTLPTNYTKKRRIGSFRTDGSAHILAFKQLGDEFLWSTTAQDVTSATVGSTASLLTLTVPGGVKVRARFHAYSTTSAANVATVFTSPDESDQATSNYVFSLNTQVANQALVGDFNVRTNTSSQIRARSVSNATVYIGTYGWFDDRGKFD